MGTAGNDRDKRRRTSSVIEPGTGEQRRRPVRPAHVAAKPGFSTTVRRAATSAAVVLVSLAVLLGAATALASTMLPDDADSGDQALAGDIRSEVPPFDDGGENAGASRSRSSSTSSSTTTSSTTTTTTTTTTTLLVVTDPPTTTTVPTTRPTTTTSTTPPPEPVINSFGATTAANGCGTNRSPATISWSTTHATSATLGRAGSGSSAVAVNGQRTDVCVDDDGETWRLTASGPGGTDTQDITIDP